MFSCSESEQKQLNTWVSFQSAEQPLLGQLSVSGNRQPCIYVRAVSVRYASWKRSWPCEMRNRPGMSGMQKAKIS
ncbi:hypothetical protein BWR59_06230 [Pseudomonas sp. Bc-h]|nr:hypothetical protein BWR59_06230 [Pseudomonas sp. Bc-h]